MLNLKKNDLNGREWLNIVEIICGPKSPANLWPKINSATGPLATKAGHGQVCIWICSSEKATCGFVMQTTDLKKARPTAVYSRFDNHVLPYANIIAGCWLAVSREVLSSLGYTLQFQTAWICIPVRSQFSHSTSNRMMLMVLKHLRL